MRRYRYYHFKRCKLLNKLQLWNLRPRVSLSVGTYLDLTLKSSTPITNNFREKTEHSDTVGVNGIKILKQEWR